MVKEFSFVGTTFRQWRAGRGERGRTEEKGPSGENWVPSGRAGGFGNDPGERISG